MALVLTQTETLGSLVAERDPILYNLKIIEAHFVLKVWIHCTRYQGTFSLMNYPHASLSPAQKLVQFVAARFLFMTSAGKPDLLLKSLCVLMCYVSFFSFLYIHPYLYLYWLKCFLQNFLLNLNIIVWWISWYHLFWSQALIRVE